MLTKLKVADLFSKDKLGLNAAYCACFFFVGETGVPEENLCKEEENM